MEYENNELVLFFNKAKVFMIENGYEDEIVWVEKQKFNEIDENHLFKQYVWVVLNSGFDNKKAEKIYDQFFENNMDFNVIKHELKKQAIKTGLDNHKEWFKKIKSLKTDEEIISYIQTFPFMGNITKYHLARNIGIDVAKPDRHMNKVAAKFGYSDVNAMCKDISKTVDEKIGVIDTILWRYCNLKTGNKAPKICKN